MFDNHSEQQKTILPLSKAQVYFDGLFSNPRLKHPEGVAIGPDGCVWCGSEDGDILRIFEDKNNELKIEKIATTNGFTLGLAFDQDKSLYVCDLKEATVFKLDLTNNSLERFTALPIKIPNYPVIWHSQNKLLVSDSHGFQQPGPGIWAIDLNTGKGELWYTESINFANGLALNHFQSTLYLFVCETFNSRIIRIPILENGMAGKAEIHVENLPGLPDGIAFDQLGNLIIGCYEPSRILRVSPDGKELEILIEDPTAHMFCHPTNIAFQGDKLYSSNLGRWHITKVNMDIGAEPLWKKNF